MSESTLNTACFLCLQESWRWSRKTGSARFRAGSSSPSRQLLFPKIARQDYQSIINAQVGITDPKSQPGSQPSPTWDVPIPSNSNNKASVFLQDICHLLIRCQENMEFWESKAPKLIPALHSKCLSRGFQKDGVFQKGQGGKFSSLWKTR